MRKMEQGNAKNRILSKVTVLPIVPVLAIALVALAITLGGCGFSGMSFVPEPYTREVFAMDTYMSVTGYGGNAQTAVDEAIEEIRRIDDLLSTGNPDSEISLLNRNGEGRMSEEGYTLVKRAVEIGDMTDGAMDITIYPLMKLWGFAGGECHVPSDEDIASTLENVDYRRIHTEDDGESGGRVQLGEGQEIDLGGIAKGYTSSRIMDIFSKYDLVAGAVSLGGNVQFYGAKADGSSYRCAIKDPNNPDDSNCMLGVLEAEDTAIITSGGYERNFMDKVTGNFYHHIMDPKTGRSADGGLISVTIVSKDGTLADALSTAVYVMGTDEGIRLWREHRDVFDMILMDDARTVYVTDGISKNFKSDYETRVIQAAK